MSERQTRRPEGEGVHGPFIRPHPASVTAGLRVTPEGRPWDRVSPRLVVSSLLRFSVRHVPHVLHPRYARLRDERGTARDERRPNRVSGEDSDRETNRKDPRLFWSLLFPLVSRGSSLISSPHPSSPHRHPRSGPEGGGDGG